MQPLNAAPSQRDLSDAGTLPATLPLPLFFFHDTATTEIYTLSLHDALPIYKMRHAATKALLERNDVVVVASVSCIYDDRSEEHTSELQSRENLVCRLLLEKKKKYTSRSPPICRWKKS